MRAVVFRRFFWVPLHIILVAGVMGSGHGELIKAPQFKLAKFDRAAEVRTRLEKTPMPAAVIIRSRRRPSIRREIRRPVTLTFTPAMLEGE
jgi:hypothetical protein